MTVVQPISAVSAGFAVNKTLVDRVYELNNTVVIPRQRLGIGVPPGYDCSNTTYPAGFIHGNTRAGTVLRFADTVTGHLVKSESFGDGLLNLGCDVQKLTIDGKAQLHQYPWDSSFGIHGADAVYRAHGLCLEGDGIHAEHINLFQIPGTALIIQANGARAESGKPTIYDTLATVDHIFISQAINGIDFNYNDLKAHDIYVTGIVKDGITFNQGGAAHIVHSYGADRAIVCNAVIEGMLFYPEAARIGLHLVSGSDGSKIEGINIGPGSCWERCILIESNGCQLSQISGTIQAASALHSDVAGIEIISDYNVHEVISGALFLGAPQVAPAVGGSTGLILRGHRHKIDLTGGWSPVYGTPTFVKVGGFVSGCRVDITGSGDDPGLVLDLSASGLDSLDGKGNEFNIKWSGTAPRVKYPGGGNTFNLVAGTTVEVDGTVEG